MVRGLFQFHGLLPFYFPTFLHIKFNSEFLARGTFKFPVISKWFLLDLWWNICSALVLLTCDSGIHEWFSLWNSMVNKTKWMTLGQCPSTHYRGRQDGFDISNTLSDSRKKELIDWGRDTARRQNINFLTALCFCRGECYRHKARAAAYESSIISIFNFGNAVSVFWISHGGTNVENDHSFGTGGGPYTTLNQMWAATNYSPNDRPAEQQVESPARSTGTPRLNIWSWWTNL